jgi:hypothetical protein
MRRGRGGAIRFDADGVGGFAMDGVADFQHRVVRPHGAMGESGLQDWEFATAVSMMKSWAMYPFVV